MRELIKVVKDGQSYANRDITGLDEASRVVALEEMKTLHPEPELEWFWHHCLEGHCEQEPIVFEPVTGAPFLPAAEDKNGVLVKRESKKTPKRRK
jgi:hypothetical protein